MKYNLIKVISEEPHSTVWLCKNGDEKFVAKIYPPEYKKLWDNEKAIFKYLTENKKSHENIIKLIECFQYSDVFYTIMEHIPNVVNLYDSVLPKDNYELINICKQISEGICFLHDEGILHHDIKLENILISQNRIVIIDFDMSFFYRQKEINTGGTETYWPPYPWSMDLSYDIYSLGVLFYEICNNKRLPFNDNLKHEQLNVIKMKEDYRQSKFPIETMNILIKNMMLTDSDKRPTIREILVVLNAIKHN